MAALGARQSSDCRRYGTQESARLLAKVIDLRPLASTAVDPSVGKRGVHREPAGPASEKETVCFCVPVFFFLIFLREWKVCSNQ